MKNTITITKSAEETKELGKKIGQSLLEEGGIIALHGDLGSGKTTFVQGLSEAFGIKDNVSSPTFVLQREYNIEDKKYSINKIYHIDLYRLHEYPKDELGINDLANEKKNIVIIEWAERMAELLPKKRLDINFFYISQNEREITIEYNTK